MVMRTTSRPTKSTRRPPLRRPSPSPSAPTPAGPRPRAARSRGRGPPEADRAPRRRSGGSGVPVADAESLKQRIRDIPDFPKAGVVFKDITPLLADREAFVFTVRQICDRFEGAGIDKVLGVEARGFIFA